MIAVRDEVLIQIRLVSDDLDRLTLERLASLLRLSLSLLIMVLSVILEIAHLILFVLRGMLGLPGWLIGVYIAAWLALWSCVVNSLLGKMRLCANG